MFILLGKPQFLLSVLTARQNLLYISTIWQIQIMPNSLELGRVVSLKRKKKSLNTEGSFWGKVKFFWVRLDLLHKSSRQISMGSGPLTMFLRGADLAPLNLCHPFASPHSVPGSVCRRQASGWLLSNATLFVSTDGLLQVTVVRILGVWENGHSVSSFTLVVNKNLFSTGFLHS